MNAGATAHGRRPRLPQLATARLWNNLPLPLPHKTPRNPLHPHLHLHLHHKWNKRQSLCKPPRKQMRLGSPPRQRLQRPPALRQHRRLWLPVPPEDVLQARLGSDV